MAEKEYFSDAALIQLLDRFPRQHLQVRSMGFDAALAQTNQLARHDGVGGAELLRAVHQGRLWLNLTRVDRVGDDWRGLIADLYAELKVQLPGFAADHGHASLLISSPRALVSYHADGPASLLWHIRGHKRVWVYPALDPRFLRREVLEDIFAGAHDEFLPYDAAFDAAAEVFDLQPGDCMAWPQNAPHRVANGDDVNVSLVTDHFTRAGRRRFQVYVANRFLRTRLGWSNPSPREEGAAAWAKTLLQRVARKIGLDRVPIVLPVASLRVAADAPGGAVALESGPAGPGHAA